MTEPDEAAERRDDHEKRGASTPRFTDSPARERRADALRQAAQDRTLRAEQAAESGIRRLIKDGGQISFQAVARASGVSTKFLHQHPDLADRIRTLRAQQHGTTENHHEAITTGESAVIAALRRQLREQAERHQREITAIRSRSKEKDQQIAILYGELSNRRER